MDPLKDKQRFDDMESQGDTPWAVWKTAEDPAGAGSLKRRGALRAR